MSETNHPTDSESAQSGNDQDEIEEKVKGRSTTRTNLILLFVTIVVLVVGLEGGARLFYWVRWDGTLYALQSRDYSLRLGWRGNPGAFRQYRISDQGFRRPGDISSAPDAGTFRVFLTGGSTAFGWSGLYPQFDFDPIDYESTIDFQLEELLRARHPEFDFEVVNASITEYRLFQEITLFREYLVGFRPDLVIFLDGHNDISLMSVGHDESQVAPYWDQRLFHRGERVLNNEGLAGPVYYMDMWLGRISYFYHGLSVVMQRLVDRSASAGPEDELDVFTVDREVDLRSREADYLASLERALSQYLAQVRDLRAIAGAREVDVLYALQPEIILEESSDLDGQEGEIQKFTFTVEGARKSLAWRYLAPRAATELLALSDERFQVLDLTRIADRSPEEVYTDYTHLTRAGNAIVAEAMYPQVAQALGLSAEATSPAPADPTP